MKVSAFINCRLNSLNIVYVTDYSQLEAVRFLSHWLLLCKIMCNVQLQCGQTILLKFAMHQPMQIPDQTKFKSMLYINQST